MPISSQSSLLIFLSKLAPQSLRCPKDQDITFPQKLSNSFAVWLEVTYAIICFVKWSQKTKTFTMFGGLIQLHCCINTGKVNVQQLQRCGNSDGSNWGFCTSVFMLDALLTVANHPLHLSGHSWSRELVM